MDIEDLIEAVENSNVERDAKAETLEILGLHGAKENVYVVVGEWRGIVDKVEVYRSEKRAQECRGKIVKDYSRTVHVFECAIIER